jgi:hypothetical protein
MSPMSTYPHGFSNGVAIRGLPVLNAYSGDVYWVDSNATRTTGSRGSFGNPFPSLAVAATNPLLDDGDMICIKAGHTETISTATITISNKIRILGLGEGALRPIFTVATASICGITVSATDVTISNLRFAASTAAVTNRIYLNAANCCVENCYFTCGANDARTINLGLTANDVGIYNNEFHVSAAGPISAVNIPSGPMRVQMRYNLFDGVSAANAWTSGAIYSSGTNCVCRVANNDFFFMYASAGGIHFGANTTGLIRDNFFGGGALGYMLVEGGAYCCNNYETADSTKSARLFPTSTG